MTMYPHLKIEKHERRGRNVYMTYSDFKSKKELQEFVQYYNDNWYVYFPHFSNIRFEDGSWKVDLTEADSCD